MVIVTSKNCTRFWERYGAKSLFFLCLLLFIKACAVIPQPLTVSDLEESAKEDRTAMFGKNEQISGSLSLEEAIARALKYNLDHRARAMEQALALNQLDVENYQLLPKLTANAGYSDRSEFNATNSKERGDGAPPSSAYSYSADRTNFTGDLALSWNVLDFGVSYFNARQNADRSLIAEEHRRKVVHNLVREVQYSYWRMVAAQKLEKRVKLAITRADQALFSAKKVEQEKLRKPGEMLRYQKQLLQNIRRLETVNQNLSSARVELAALINLPPTTRFRVVPPLTDTLVVPKWSLPIQEMEMLAFQHNPDIREKLYMSRINLNDTRKALAGLLPGIDLSVGRNYDSNSFLDVNRWYEWSSTLSLNVMKLLSLPANMKYNEASQALSDAQRIALRMAVLAQVHVADIQYFNAVKQFKRADEMFLIDKRLSKQISKRQESDIQSLLDRISQETAAIDSVMRRYQTYSEVIAAVGRLHSTLGISIFKPGTQAKELKDLTRKVAKAMHDRMTGLAIKTELKTLMEAQNSKTVQKSNAPKKMDLLGKLWDWSQSYFSRDIKQKKKDVRDQSGNPRLGKKTPQNNMVVEVSLNENMAGGRLQKTDVLCKSVSRIEESKGWVRIAAESVEKENVEGWMHQVYSKKLRQQCNYQVHPL